MQSSQKVFYIYSYTLHTRFKHWSFYIQIQSHHFHLFDFAWYLNWPSWESTNGTSDSIAHIQSWLKHNHGSFFMTVNYCYLILLHCRETHRFHDMISNRFYREKLDRLVFPSIKKKLTVYSNLIVLGNTINKLQFSMI